jgi:hypothetical protein
VCVCEVEDDTDGQSRSDLGRWPSKDVRGVSRRRNQGLRPVETC